LLGAITAPTIAQASRGWTRKEHLISRYPLTIRVQYLDDSSRLGSQFITRGLVVHSAMEEAAIMNFYRGKVVLVNGRFVE